MAKKESQHVIWKRTLEGARELILLQGEVIYAANLLQDEYFRLFLTAIRFDRPTRLTESHLHALAIWHTILADSSQRDMAFAAISTLPTDLNLEPAVKRLDWATKSAGKLAAYRNLVAHSAILFGARPVGGGKWKFGPHFSGWGMRPAHARRMAVIQDDTAIWQIIRDDLLALTKFLGSVRVQIHRLEVESRGGELLNEPRTWPRKPKLRSLPLFLALDQKAAPATRKPKRRSRPRSSPK